MKKIISSLIACICIMVMTSCGPKSPSAIAEDYLENIKEGNYKELVDGMYFKKAMSEQDKAELVNMLEEKAAKTIDKKGAVESFEIVNEEINEDGTLATVNYVINYANKKGETDKVKLIKVDGQWMVNSGK